MTTTVVTAIISWAVSFFLGGVVSFLATRHKKVTNQQKALSDGVQSLLRNNIIQTHDKFTEKGYCPIYAKEALRHSYEAYHELGGNGVVTKLYNDIMALPEEAPIKKQNGGNNNDLE